MKLSKIKPNTSNPRTISGEALDKLILSINDFPKMMKLRPIVVDSDMVILGGNMRYAALKKLKHKDIPDEWVKVADDLTKEERERFIIEDNVQFGEWDIDMLDMMYDSESLTEWGLEVPDYGVDYSEKNKEIDFDELSKEMVIKLTYSEEEYVEVKDLLSKIASTPEQAVWKLLGK